MVMKCLRYNPDSEPFATSVSYIPFTQTAINKRTTNTGISPLGAIARLFRLFSRLASPRTAAIDEAAIALCAHTRGTADAKGTITGKISGTGEREKSPNEITKLTNDETHKQYTTLFISSCARLRQQSNQATANATNDAAKTASATNPNPERSPPSIVEANLKTNSIPAATDAKAEIANAEYRFLLFRMATELNAAMAKRSNAP